MRRPLRAEDALFLYAQTPLLCQQVGAVVLLGPGQPGTSGFSSPGVDGTEFRAAMAERLQAVPELRWRLERPHSGWRRPCWVRDEDVDAGELLPADEVYPVLPLADGVGLAIGAMTWDRSLSVGILADAALVPDADKLAAELAEAVRNYCRVAT